MYKLSHECSKRIWDIEQEPWNYPADITYQAKNIRIPY